MYLYVFISVVAHVLVFAGLVLAPLIGGRRTPPVKTVTVAVVTPQSIASLLARNADIVEPKPNVIQVPVEKDKLIPDPEKRQKKVQPVKRAAAETSKPARETGKSDAAGKSNLPDGVQTDQQVDNAYLAEIVGIIHSNWRYPNLNDPNIKAVVFFEIGRDGGLIRLRVEKGSRNMTFDTSAHQAVLQSKPFPPLPDNFTGIKLGIHLAFSY